MKNFHEELFYHPKLGASWEGMALEEVIRYLRVESGDCYFWGVHAQAELDLLVMHNSKRFGFEFKYTDQPKVTKSMHAANAILRLDKLYLIFPGREDFPLAENIRAIGVEKFLSTMEGI